MSDILIFILDDDDSMNEMIDRRFKKAEITGYTIFSDYNKFFEAYNQDVKVCVLDYYLLQDLTGFDVMKKIIEINPSCYIIILSGTANFDLLIEIINYGSMKKYVNKNDNNFMDKLVLYVKEAIRDIKFLNGLIERVTP